MTSAASEPEDSAAVRAGEHAAESDEHVLAAAYLSRVAEPASVALFLFVEQVGYIQAAKSVRAGAVTAEVAACTQARHDSVDPEADLDAAARNNIRLLTPASPQWPHFAFAALNSAARRRAVQWHAGFRRRAERGELIPPLALWVQGNADLSTVGTSSLAVVGSRASTAYGDHVATDWCYSLAGRNVVIVSGGAYGIDAAAHRGALAADGVCILVSAGGLDRPYPAGHAVLYQRVAERGLVVSERPPGSAPHRQRFLSRNRLIAALGTATLVVEAAHRSGALNSAGYARDLGRPVLAVPGPVTSAMSQGCHRLLRRDDEPARLVGSSEEVLEYCGPSAQSGSLTRPIASPQVSQSKETSSVTAKAEQQRLFDTRDALSLMERAILDGFPARGWVTEAELSRLCAQPIQSVVAALPSLTELGLVKVARQGYHLVQP